MTLEEALGKFRAPVAEDGSPIPYFLFWRPVFDGPKDKERPNKILTCFEISGALKATALLPHYAGKQGWKLVKCLIPQTRDFAQVRQSADLFMGAIEPGRVKELEAERDALLQKLHDAESKAERAKK